VREAYAPPTVEAAERAAARSLPARLRGSLLPAVGIGLVLIAWWASVAVFRIPGYVVPAPGDVLGTLIDDREALAAHTRYTAVVVLGGFLLAIATGIPLAMLIAFSRTLSSILYPLIVSTQAVPKVALAPVILMWSGFGPRTGILVTLLISFFPIVVDTALGLRSMPIELRWLALSMGAGRWRTFVKIRLPFALPFIFSGLKIAITLSVVGAVVGELVASNEGLGYYLLLATAHVHTSRVFADILILSALATLMFGVVQAVEAVIIPWHRHRKG